MRRRAETVEADALSFPCPLQRPPADQPRAQKRRRGDGIGVGIEVEGESRIRHDMRREPAVAGVAGEQRRIAEVFRARAAIGACAAGMAEPGHAGPASHPRRVDARPYCIDDTDDFMPGNQRQLRMIELAVDDMQVRAADGAGFDLQPYLSRARRRIRPLHEDERHPRPFENHRFHWLPPEDRMRRSILVTKSGLRLSSGP